MRLAEVWRQLGIEATEDVGAIRKAYAKALKAIDVDADAQAFIKLREARDEALHSAGAASAPSPVPAFAGEDFDFSALDAQIFSEGWRREAPLEPALAELPVLAKIRALLFSEDESPADAERLEALTAELLADPAMQSVSAAQAMEYELAELALEAMPRSDPMLGPLAAHFGWEAREAEWDLDPDIAALEERRRSLLFLQAISKPGHPHHEAWRDLCSKELKLGWVFWPESAAVAKLLGLIRERYPSAEQGLDWHRVALWDAHLASSVQRGLKIAAVIFWIAFVAFRLWYFVGWVSG